MYRPMTLAIGQGCFVREPEPNAGLSDRRTLCPKRPSTKSPSTSPLFALLYERNCALEVL